MTTLWTRIPRRIDEAWFDREQASLVSLANNPWWRRYLGLDRWIPEHAGRQILGIASSGVVLAGDRLDQRIAVFTSGNVFAIRLHQFAQMVRRGSEFEARLRLDSPAREALAWAVANTSVFSPDASPETTCCDGMVEANNSFGNSSFADMHTGGGSTTLNTNHGSSPIYAADEEFNGNGAGDNWQDMGRGFFLFDTRILTTAGAITAATFSLYCVARTDPITNQYVALVTSSPASNTTLVGSDYNQVGTVRQATDVIFGGFTASAYNDMALNSTGRGNISKTGITKFGTRTAADADNASFNSNSAAFSYVQVQSAEGANKPKLTVTYNMPWTPVLMMGDA